MRPHVGTADLDFHLSLHLLDGETADYYQAIIDGLRSLGLRTDLQAGREVKWRWVGHYRDARLQVEFLCPMRGRGPSREARNRQPALEAAEMRAALDEHYAQYPEARPDLADIAIAIAELDGNPLAADPDRIRRVAAEIAGTNPSPEPDDVLIRAEARAYRRDW